MIQFVVGFKTELRPTLTQGRLMDRAVGTARFVYNWGLERNNNIYLFNQLPHEPIKYESSIDQHKLLNQRKANDFPWMYEISKCVPQESLRDLGNAFHNFLVRRDHFMWPVFKSKRGSNQSFTLTGAIHVADRAIKLPRLGRVKLKESGYLPTRHHILSATISKRAGRWFVSIGARKRIRVPKNDGPVVGVDWGVSHLVTVSDGTMVEGSRPLKRLRKRLVHVQKDLSRKLKGSKNRHKTLLRLQKLHWRIGELPMTEVIGFLLPWNGTCLSAFVG